MPTAEVRQPTPRRLRAGGPTLGGRLVGRFHLGDGLVAGRVDREHAVEPGDLEDLRDVPIAADERKLPLVRAQALDPTYKHAEGGRVDEGRVAEVDDHLLPALADHFEELLLELGRGVQVDLACQRDHVSVVSQLLRLDVEVHRPPGGRVTGLPVAESNPRWALRTVAGS